MRVVGYTKNNKGGNFMEKAKKTTKTAGAKKTTVKASPAKVEKVKKVQPVAEVVEAPVVKTEEVKAKPAVAEVKAQPKKTTLNQELNLLIGLFSLLTIITFCFAFQGGDAEVLGWELVLNAGNYSGVFKGLMILYIVAIFIECILAIRIDSENEIINIVEKALYMFTIIINAIVVAVLLSIIKTVGIGLVILFILSIISTIVKFARIYAQK